MRTAPILDDDGNRVGTYWACYCGFVVEAYGGHDVSCQECGKMYNAFGQELRPQSQWEENDDY